MIFLSYRSEAVSPALSEQEFEEIFQRNKTVSSSAISRAVQDASAGKITFTYSIKAPFHYFSVDQIVLSCIKYISIATQRCLL